MENGTPTACSITAPMLERRKPDARVAGNRSSLNRPIRIVLSKDHTDPQCLVIVAALGATPIYMSSAGTKTLAAMGGVAGIYMQAGANMNGTRPPRSVLPDSLNCTHPD